jgi:hypothetical protein
VAERGRRPAPIGALPAYVGAVVVATAAILTAYGRGWWCPAGDLAPWSWQTAAVHNSQHLLDPYSFTHFEHGLCFFAGLWLFARRRPVRLRFAIAVTIAAIWELVENSDFIIDRYRAQTVDVGYYGDSVLNSLADVGWCALGFALAARLRWGWSVAIVVATEAILAVTIRDNLLFNVVTLIHPIDALVRWQRAR